MNDYLCACNGKLCEGICKKANLHRPRPKFIATGKKPICPAAYKERGKRNEDSSDDKKPT